MPTNKEVDCATRDILFANYASTDAFIRAIYRAGYAAGLEAAAKVCENGRFLHDDAPDARWAKSCAAAIRALNTTKEK